MLMASRSLVTLAANFDCQNATFDFGV
ncbi:hypothetical protein AvCA_36060 [Azotobacter vinelandii CA]|uniref:Uncharacterized protein n=2 Tax=Azotobacter vinelandii TaxID=354 RepID=C1DR95_AZOVD|nr:hypothetical protein Avin_36060 [Azotobacter vinelandii DJ]AGK14584.1 hypothetical protein AvCA_36060 [Azotobacter vinelandii CA]AGK21471.1 hypothetical protein AvCA6_36060 [Azotobacter vinelandii CA6]